MSELASEPASRSAGELTVAIDFGTTNTVAVARRDGAAPRVVSVDGAPQLPSAVFLGDDGGLVVGTDALRLGRSAPHRLEPRPKARLDEDTLLLGETTVDVLAAVRAVLSRVCSAAARQAGGPIDHLVLTHPADWGPVRMGRLPRAAAGLASRLSLVPEPVAAAVRAGLADGAAVLVVDLGGGTSDAAVVRRHGSGFAVLACAGLPDLGGDDLDQRIVDRLRTAAEPPADDKARRAELLVRQDARAAKELLSRHESALLSAGAAEPATLSRAEFETLVADDLLRVVELAGRVVESSGVDRATLRAVHLVGGTSRIPRVAELLRTALELPVHPDPEPEAGVAWGAVGLAAADESVTPTRPVHPAPVVPGAPSRPRRTRALAAAGTVVLTAAALVTAGVLAGGKEVGGTPVAVRAGGHPTATSDPDAPDPMPEFPPVRPGSPVTGPGSPNPTVVPPGGTGLFRATGTYEGATETRVEVRLQRGEVADRTAPAGYRWVVAGVETTLRVEGELNAGDGHNVYLLDDRGQLVDTVDRAGDVTVELCGSSQQDLPATPQGTPRIECAAFLVPAATAVRGVVYVDRTVDRLGAHALLFPADLPATGPAAPPGGEGQVGGPPLEVDTGSGYADVAIADLIDTPSAYLADPKPPPGSRQYVVRFSMRAGGVGTARLPSVAGALHVLDDRGLLVSADVFVRYHLRECPDPYEEPPDVPPGDTAQGCLVFGLARDATISRIVYAPRTASGAPADWRIWNVPT
ncbi:Hsp70 family protein [Actinophytocola algeriensis]|uniref:Actin-like ATPase involved in cell morphogenesis n=1 Tax=Actinophytocola algeriensis TaxID=1768010 RepID=A0A7W7Q2T5_9PSEU|nr:Hsp70 family protein [Actinophytocola algeriensis]MBB4905931.1 actin-like ATPase involved in cell morphogenesis [Actinophytocola algeriensis]MBE1472384.1 actin-like ATPase involved in cell morphogenesis [Actinophytocola algeriensis]